MSVFVILLRGYNLCSSQSRNGVCTKTRGLGIVIMQKTILDLFSIGIGPSSSHTVGPMRAALGFATRLRATHGLAAVHKIHITLYGSLAATAAGHGSRKAILLGLMGLTPEGVNVDEIPTYLSKVQAAGVLDLLGERHIPFDLDRDLTLKKRERLDFHVNGMQFEALSGDGMQIYAETLYSIGGGFVVGAEEAAHDQFDTGDAAMVPYPFASGEELLNHCTKSGLSISDVILANEDSFRPRAETESQLLAIWQAMQACVQRGCSQTGNLPGLNIRRRAADLYAKMRQNMPVHDPLVAMDWVNLWALAVNEENAIGGRVVTAPTNGAAGIIPAVLHYYRSFIGGATDAGVIRFLLTAGAIGLLFKENASISGAEVGCQGEVGSACSMAAAGLCEVMGGTPEQVENAAEIGMEHNLGLTCDPVGGLVQVPCIERNAMGAIKAINAARLAIKGDGDHFVSLDKVIRTMRLTGRDMKTQYKETARGGLAAEIQVTANIVDC